MKHIMLLMLLSGLLTACFGGGEVVPQDRFYHLADPAGETVRYDKPFGVIAVAPMRSDALHQERMILYSLQSSPLALNTYFYHQWSNTPGMMIQENLIAYLRDVNFAKSIVRYGDREHSDGEISGYIHRFERIVGNGNPRVIVRLEFSFIPATSLHRQIFTRVYSVERQASDNTMEATVAAFSSVLQSIYGHFVADVIHEYSVSD